MRKRSLEIIVSVSGAIRKVIGINEVAIYTSLALISCGAWQVYKPAAFLVPGVIMLWMYLPQRVPFFSRHESIESRRSKA